MVSKKDVEKKIMVFGTFDGLHPGHLNFFMQARKLAPKTLLIISVARDKNVLRVKGRRPLLNERKRVAFLKKSGLADKVVLSGIRNHIPHIVRARPDVVALGYDQKVYVRNLKRDLKKKGLAVKIARLKPYKEKIYKNSLIKKHTTPSPS